MFSNLINNREVDEGTPVHGPSSQPRREEPAPGSTDKSDPPGRTTRPHHSTQTQVSSKCITNKNKGNSMTTMDLTMWEPGGLDEQLDTLKSKRKVIKTKLTLATKDLQIRLQSKDRADASMVATSLANVESLLDLLQRLCDTMYGQSTSDTADVELEAYMAPIRQDVNQLVIAANRWMAAAAESNKEAEKNLNLKMYSKAAATASKEGYIIPPYNPDQSGHESSAIASAVSQALSIHHAGTTKALLEPMAMVMGQNYAVTQHIKPPFSGEKGLNFNAFLLQWKEAEKVLDQLQKSDAQKLIELKKVLSGEALKMINNLPPLDLNYQGALNHLKTLYDDRIAAVQQAIQKLLEAKNERHDWRFLYTLYYTTDTLLGSLNLSETDLIFAFFTSICELSMPQKGRENWMKKLRKLRDDSCPLGTKATKKDFFDFLQEEMWRETTEKHEKAAAKKAPATKVITLTATRTTSPTVAAFNRGSASKQPFTRPSNPAPTQRNMKRGENTRTPKFRGGQAKRNMQTSKTACLACEKEGHKTIDCSQLVKIDPAALRKRIRIQKRCKKCFEAHSTIKCTLPACRCGLHHHKSICFEKLANSAPKSFRVNRVAPCLENPSFSKLDPKKDTKMSLRPIVVGPAQDQRGSSMILKTIMCNVINDDGDQFRARVFLDTGAAVSLISEWVATRLELQPLSVSKLSVSGALGCKSEAVRTKQVLFRLQSLDETWISPNMTAQTVQSIGIVEPAVDFDPKTASAAWSGVTFADTFPRPAADIDLLLDMVQTEMVLPTKIIRPFTDRHFPFAFHTKLGWGLAGHQPLMSDIENQHLRVLTGTAPAPRVAAASAAPVPLIDLLQPNRGDGLLGEAPVTSQVPPKIVPTTQRGPMFMQARLGAITQTTPATPVPASQGEPRGSVLRPPAPLLQPRTAIPRMPVLPTPRLAPRVPVQPWNIHLTQARARQQHSVTKKALRAGLALATRMSSTPRTMTAGIQQRLAEHVTAMAPTTSAQTALPDARWAVEDSFGFPHTQEVLIVNTKDGTVPLPRNGYTKIVLKACGHHEAPTAEVNLPNHTLEDLMRAADFNSSILFDFLNEGWAVLRQSLVTAQLHVRHNLRTLVHAAAANVMLDVFAQGRQPPPQNVSLIRDRLSREAELVMFRHGRLQEFVPPQVRPGLNNVHQPQGQGQNLPSSSLPRPPVEEPFLPPLPQEALEPEIILETDEDVIVIEGEDEEPVQQPRREPKDLKGKPKRSKPRAETSQSLVAPHPVRRSPSPVPLVIDEDRKSDNGDPDTATSDKSAQSVILRKRLGGPLSVRAKRSRDPRVRHGAETSTPHQSTEARMLRDIFPRDPQVRLERVNVTQELQTLRTQARDRELETLVRRMTAHETLGISPDDYQLTTDDLEAVTRMRKVTHFRVTATNDSNNDGRVGRYYTELLWKESALDKLTNDNYFKAKAVLKSVEKRLTTPELRAEVDKNYMALHEGAYADELVQPEELSVAGKEGNPDKLYYLETHAVIRPESSTHKIRIVMNAASRSKTNNGLSLNDLLLQGPTMLPDIIRLLIHFRSKPIGITSDISKMFLQIKLSLDRDKNVLRFLWRGGDERNPMRTFRMNCLTFGIVSSPFQASFVVALHAENHKDEFPLAFKALKNFLYVDDLVYAVDNEQEAEDTIRELLELFRIASMKIHKWQSNCKPALNIIPSADNAVSEENVKILGTTWHTQTDFLTFEFAKSVDSPMYETKRTILAQLAKIYDVLGLISPFTIVAKVLFQDLWLKELTWDQPVDPDTGSKYASWKSQIIQLSDIKIPRYPFANKEVVSSFIAAFGDASQKAYGVAVYIVRRHTDGTTSSNLMVSKAKVAPANMLKQGEALNTIVRLELMAAVLCARLGTYVSQATEIAEVHFFSDSQITLARLKKPARSFKVWVGNRITDIIKHSGSYKNWHYVPTKQNPADLTSRGTEVSELINNELWWNGPSFLQEEASNWPKAPYFDDEEDEGRKDTRNDEFKKYLEQGCRVFVLKIPVKKEVELFHTHMVAMLGKQEKFRTVVKIIAFILRWKNYKRSQPKQFGRKFKPNFLAPHVRIKPAEFQQASNTLWQLVQRQCFPKELDTVIAEGGVSKNSVLRDYNPFLENGLLKSHTRLSYSAELRDETKFPILLPKHNCFVEKFVLHLHIGLLHCGANQCLNLLQAGYRIVGGKSEVRRIIRTCKRQLCRQPSLYAPPIAPLPSLRIDRPVPFQCVGVDFYGPIMTKHVCKEKECPHAEKEEKTWGCVFTCFITRAVHLDIVGNMTTKEFLACFTRMIARRGCPTYIFSDCAKTFKAADKELRALYKAIDFNQVENETVARGITWKYNIELGPWGNGITERMVGLVKKPLKIALGSRTWSKNQLYTVLTEIEALINSRPLAAAREAFDDVSPITPSELCIGRKLLHIPDGRSTKLHTIEKTDFVAQLRIRRHVMGTFWRKWVNDYLLQLAPEKLWRKNEATAPIKIDDVVVIKEDTLKKRQRWILGRVLQTFPGKDGIIRAVQLRTGDGKTVRRPVRRLALLEQAAN